MQTEVITKQEFINEVLYEINNLKIHAKPEEINTLNIKDLIPRDKTRCIYGLMTGSCNSIRAYQLMIKCTNSITMRCLSFTKEDYISSMLIYHVNPRASRTKALSYFTLLEVFIYNFPQYNENIIKYLKNEITELELKLE